jgi:TonB family protein
MLPRGGDMEAQRQAAAAEARRELGPGQTAGGSSGGPPAVSNLLANLGPEEVARQDGFDSHVDDMDEGDQTALNTRQTRYADFFTRVVHSVRQHWHAVDAHRQHDPYGHVYGVRDRVTVVDVTLNPDGSLDDIKVAQDSGVAYLDEAALKAFRDAQPFPNPPPGLRDPDGRIRFRFQFWLEIDGAGGFRLFRNTD